MTIPSGRSNWSGFRLSSQYCPTAADRTKVAPLSPRPAGQATPHGLPMTCIHPPSHFNRSPRCRARPHRLLLRRRTPTDRRLLNTAPTWPSRQRQSPPGCCSPSPAVRHQPNRRMVTAWCRRRRLEPLASRPRTVRLALLRSLTPRHQCLALPTAGREPHQPGPLLHPPPPAIHRHQQSSPLRTNRRPRHRLDQPGAGRKDSNHHLSNLPQRHRQPGSPSSPRRRPTTAVNPQ